MNKPELLAPAGDMEKLKTALYFGADAVYLGGPGLHLRAAGYMSPSKPLPGMGISKRFQSMPRPFPVWA